MLNIISVMKPILKSRKLKHDLEKAEKEREEELTHFSERGFDSSENYKTFLDQQDKSRAIVFEKAKNLSRVRSNNSKILSQIEAEKGKDSEEFKEAEKKFSEQEAQAKVILDTILKAESKKLGALTPSNYKKAPMSKGKKIGIAGLVVAAAAGIGYYLTKNDFFGKNKNVQVLIPNNVDVNVIDPYKIPEDFSKEQSEILKEVIESSDYKEQVSSIVNIANAKIETTTNLLNQDYNNLEAFSNEAKISEISITGYDSELVNFDGHIRSEGDSFLTFCVKTIQESNDYIETETPRMIEEFRQYFPTVSKMYDDLGIEITADNLLGYPSVVDYREYLNAVAVDEQTAGFSKASFLNRRDNLNIYKEIDVQERFEKYMTKYKDQLSPDQEKQLQDLIDSSNEHYAQFDQIVDEFNEKIIELQQSYLENSFSVNLSDQVFAGLVTSDQNNLGNLVDDSVDSVSDTISNALDDGLSF